MIGISSSPPFSDVLSYNSGAFVEKVFFSFDWLTMALITGLGLNVKTLLGLITIPLPAWEFRLLLAFLFRMMKSPNPEITSLSSD